MKKFYVCVALVLAFAGCSKIVLPGYLRDGAVAADVHALPSSDAGAKAVNDTSPIKAVDANVASASDAAAADGTRSPADAEPAQAKAASTPSTPSTLAIRNLTGKATVVYVAFGADSVILSGAWKFCTKTANLNCNFPLAKKSVQVMPLGGLYVNATISFGAAVTCGITKAEVNLNNSTWYDTTDVSLVDGYSNKVSIQATATGQQTAVVMGPPVGPTGNEKVFGLFPLGCDICVARQNPPCGIAKGTKGCKTGTQYKPDVICQFQGPTKTGGQAVEVRLH